MSTTVTYEGSTIATVENNTKTLQTAGKYLTDDITLVDASGADLPTIDIAWDSSYTTRTITCDETFSECWDRYYNGDNGVYVYTHDNVGWEEKTTAVVGDAIGSDYIAYVVSGSYGPVYDIMYYPNGTMTIVEPSAFAENLSVTANGEYYPSKGVYASVNVNVSGGGSPNLQNKTVSPSESQQTVQADSGYDGLDTVTVNAVSSSYVGSGITKRSSTDLTASGATVTVPAGLYSEQATKSVASGTEGTPVATKGTVSNHAVSVTPSVTNTEGYISGGARAGTAVSVSASELVSGTLTVDSSGTKDVTNYASVSVPAGSATTPATAITSNPSISVDSAGLITATTSASQQVAPTVSAGYVSEGTAGTVTVSGSSTEQLPTLGAQTVTPTKSSQTVQTTGKYMTGDVTVDPIPSQYIVPSGSVTITENGNTDVTDKASVTVAISYATITVSSSAPSGGSDGDVWIQN